MSQVQVSDLRSADSLIITRCCLYSTVQRRLNDSYLWPLLCAAIVAGLILCSKRRFCRLKLPPSPPGWPIIGHLHILKGPLHQSLCKLSKIYGPIFLIRLGSVPTVVVSSPEWAREFLHVHDRDFADRPQLEASKRLFYGNMSVVTLEHGPLWRELRKMYTVQIFAAKRIDMFERVRNGEIAAALQLAEQQAQQSELVVEMSKFVFNIIGNMMTSMLFSKRSFGSSGSHSMTSKFKDMVQEMAVLFGAPIIGDIIPCFRWLDLRGYKKRMDNLATRFDMFLDEILNERLREKPSVKIKDERPADFLDLLLIVYRRDQGLDCTTVKSILLDLLSAGTETSTTAVVWAMAELLQNPHCMAKLQRELDAAVEREPSNYVDEGGVLRNLQDLDYLQAVLKETLRLHPPLPVVIRQMSRWLTGGEEVGGYKLPEKSRLLVNVWAMGRDAKLWEEAEHFRPERFVGGGVDVRGQNFELLPFGSGRRGCPGMNLGLTMVGLVIGNLVWRFDWKLGGGETAKTLDMTEVVSRTGTKAKPLIAVARSREQSTGNSESASLSTDS